MSSRCQCLTNAGVQCERPAQPGSDKCWQHQKGCRPLEAKQKVGATAPIPTQKITPEPYQDWTKVATKRSDAQYDYWVIPTNTTLYKGLDIAIPDDALPKLPAFYGTLGVASGYGFGGIVGTETRGEKGKVITVITTDDIILLDLSSSKTLRSLRNLKNVPLEDIKLAFGNPASPYRYSRYDADMKISDWICKEGFDGFAYVKLTPFHNEIMLCNNDKIRRGDLEYRTITSQEPCIYEISQKEGYKRTLPGITHNSKRIYAPASYINFSESSHATDRQLSSIIPQERKLCEPVNVAYKTRLEAATKAAQNGDVDTLHKLLEEDISPKIILSELDADHIDRDILKLLIEYGADPSVIAERSDLDKGLYDFAISHGASTQSFTSYYVKAHDLNALQAAISDGLDINQVFDNMVMSPNTVPVSMNALQLLINSGLDVDNKLIGAFNQGKDEIVKVFVENGAKFLPLFKWIGAWDDRRLINLLNYAGDKISQSELLYLKDKIEKEWNTSRKGAKDILQTIDRLLKREK